MGEGGGSAERRARDLGAAGDPAAGAWAAGAEGERRVAAELSGLREAWTVLHDRLLRPGRSEANLDHVVVGPPGLFLIDAKNRAGLVTEWEGGLYQHVERDGVTQHVSLADELRKVHGMAAYMAVESDAPVLPVLCLAGPHEASFGEPRPVRGVWVVPVSQLVTWLESRPAHFDRNEVERRSTRAMTDFPSTATDPELLAAMGQSTVRPDASRRANQARPTPPWSGPIRRPPVRPTKVRRPGRLRSLFAGLAVLALVLALVQVVVPAVVGGLTRATTRDIAAGGAGSSSGIPDCSHVTGAQVSTIVGRSLQPVATPVGCAWGTRLDDPSTTVVTLRLQPSHAAYETQLVTSVTQHRVVYGTGLDASYHAGTALWVAKDQPIGAGSTAVMTRADTQIVVSTATLKVSDDKGRAIALALAKVANSAT